MTTTAPDPTATPPDDVHAWTGPETKTAYTPAVDLVVPVYNEERDLEPCVRRLHDYLTAEFPFTFRITIADNASTDATWRLARSLAARLPHVHAVRLSRKGRGRALHAVWSASDATVLAYTDVDLSTDLAALLPLVAPLLSGHSDLAIGSRLTRSARVVRGPKREVISRCYNAVLHATLGTTFSDAQCGFKAIRADRARVLLPHVEDPGWFFDTELLVLAERTGLRIHEVPVDWVDDPDSRVDLLSTAIADLKGIARVGWGLTSGGVPLAALREEIGVTARPPTSMLGQGLRFAGIGVVSTVAYLLLYLLLRPMLPALGANAIALVVTAIANTAANRRFTFEVRGRASALRQHLQGLAVFGAALGLTSSALATLTALDPHPARLTELVALVAANVAATALRFLAFRSWIFRPRRLVAAPITGEPS